MLKISRLTDYAVVVLGCLARSAPGQNGLGQNGLGQNGLGQNGPGPNGLVRGDDAARSGQRLAELSGIPAPTVAKLLKQLARGGVVESVRGAGGGYRLARPAAAITIADIVQAVDGPIAVTDCVDANDEACARNCFMRGRWEPVNAMIRDTLANVTLEDMSWPAARLDPLANDSRAPVARPAVSHAG